MQTTSHQSQITTSDEKVSKWIGSQEIIYTEPNKYGELFVIVKSNLRYSLYHFFFIGENIQCSADHSGMSAEQLAIAMLSKYATA